MYRNKLIKAAAVFLKCLFIITVFVLPVEAKPLSVNWYKPVYQDQIRLTLPSDDKASVSFDFSAVIAPELNPSVKAVLITTTLNNDTVNYYYPVVKGKVSGTVYLRFGKGVYHVEIGLVKPFTDPSVIRFERAAGFSVEKLDATDRRYLQPSWGIESDNREIIDLASGITKNLKDDYHKAQAIHDWVAKNIKYDMDKYRQNKIYDIGSTVDTVRSRKGLCRDYSNLTTALLRAAGIEARTVIGQAKTDGKWYGHAWTEAKIGNRWITIDATWDSGIVKGNTFVPRFGRKYFDIQPKLFNQMYRKTQTIY